MYCDVVWFGLLGGNASAISRVISRPDMVPTHNHHQDTTSRIYHTHTNYHNPVRIHRHKSPKQPNTRKAHPQTNNQKLHDSNQVKLANTHYLKHRRGFKICNLNIRSLTKNFDPFKLEFQSSGIQVITLTETWLKSTSQNSLIQMEGYTLTRQDRSRTHYTRAKHGGGLAIYSSSDISIDTNILQHLNTCNDHIESQWVILRPTNMKKIALGNIYRPPSGDQQIFITSLQEALVHITTLKKHEICILGDRNTDYGFPNNPATKELKHTTIHFNLEQHIKDPTRQTRNTSTTLDLIFTQMTHVRESGVMDINISDHQPVYIIKKKRHSKHKKLPSGDAPTNTTVPDN